METMKATRKRIISSVLIFTMILSILPSFTVLAVDQQPEEDISAFVGVPALENVPFCVDEAVVSDAGHTVRLKYLEDSDNIAVFSNPDGTATKYIFSNPIKYIDDNGDYVDIDNTVETFGELTDEYKFKTKSAPATTYLPATIGMGENVKVEHNGFSVQIIPMSDRFAAGTTVASELKTGKDSAVLYSNVFGAGRSLKYTTLYNGVKEDIILNSYIANSNSFNFILKTNGLELAEINGGYFFVDEEDAVIYELSPIFVYDSAEVPNTTGGTYAIEEIKPNDIYALTLTVDDTWLSSATYPVTIDPTITYDDSDGLEDAFQINGNMLSTGGSNVLYIGSSGNNAARSFIRFPELLNDITPDIVTSVTLKIKNYSSYQAGGFSFEVYPINRQIGWVEYDHPASLPFNYYGQPCVNASGYGSSWSNIDITQIYEKWNESTTDYYSKENGLLLKMAGSMEQANPGYVLFHSSEATNAADKPYLEITYYFLDNLIVSFKNAYSNHYMTTANGWAYSGMNIYQESKTNSDYNSQKYRLRYDASNDAYRIYPMCSMYGRGTVVDVYKINNSIQAGCNIDTWRLSTNYNDCQLFKILSMSDGTYKLLLEHNENLVIAVNDNLTGSSSETSNASDGNIFLASISNSNDAKQRWFIEPQPEDIEKDAYYSNMSISHPFGDEYEEYNNVSSSYGERSGTDPTNHCGLDLTDGTREGTWGVDVYSMFAGEVVEIGYANDGPNDARGNYIIVESTNYTVYGGETKLRYCYMHLKEINVLNGQKLSSGQKVGQAGDTGNVSKTGDVNDPNNHTGSHLHITIITNGSTDTSNYSNTIDPMVFFDEYDFTYSFSFSLD